MIDVNKIGTDLWWLPKAQKQQTAQPPMAGAGMPSMYGEYASDPNYQKMMQQYYGGGGVPTQPTQPQQPGMELFDFQYPEQWQWASDLMRKMAETGMPTSYSDWYQQAKPVALWDIEEAIKGSAEKAGLRGERWSTAMARSAADIAAQRMGALGTDWLGRELGAGEAARQRQLQAAGGLAGLGGQYAQLPMDVSQQMFNQGNIMQQMRMQEFLRTLPENSPWLQYLMQSVGGQQTPQGYPMYQQGWGSGMMDIGTMMMLMQMLGKG